MSADQTLDVLKVLDDAKVLKGGMQSWLNETALQQLDEAAEARRWLDDSDTRG